MWAWAYSAFCARCGITELSEIRDGQNSYPTHIRAKATLHETCGTAGGKQAEKPSTIRDAGRIKYHGT